MPVACWTGRHLDLSKASSWPGREGARQGGTGTGESSPEGRSSGPLPVAHPRGPPVLPPPGVSQIESRSWQTPMPGEVRQNRLCYFGPRLIPPPPPLSLGSHPLLVSSTLSSSRDSRDGTRCPLAESAGGADVSPRWTPLPGFSGSALGELGAQRLPPAGAGKQGSPGRRPQAPTPRTGPGTTLLLPIFRHPRASCQLSPGLC